MRELSAWREQNHWEEPEPDTGHAEPCRQILPPSQSLLELSLIRHSEETRWVTCDPAIIASTVGSDEAENPASVASAVAEQDKERGRGVVSTFWLSGKPKGLEVEQKANADRTISWRPLCWPGLRPRRKFCGMHRNELPCQNTFSFIAEAFESTCKQ